MVWGGRLGCLAQHHSQMLPRHLEERVFVLWNSKDPVLFWGRCRASVMQRLVGSLLFTESHCLFAQYESLKTLLFLEWILPVQIRLGGAVSDQAMLGHDGKPDHLRAAERQAGRLARRLSPQPRK